MDELDALVEECRGKGAFASGTVRDTSNRSGRDWLWWSVEIERTDSVGLENLRRTAEISLNSPAPGVPSQFEGRWSARAWRGVGTDFFSERGSCPLVWDNPSGSDLNNTMAALFSEAAIAVGKAIGRNFRSES
jgi:hypothetical protein